MLMGGYSRGKLKRKERLGLSSLSLRNEYVPLTLALLFTAKRPSLQSLGLGSSHDALRQRRGRTPLLQGRLPNTVFGATASATAPPRTDRDALRQRRGRAFFLESGTRLLTSDEARRLRGIYLRPNTVFGATASATAPPRTEP